MDSYEVSWSHEVAVDWDCRTLAQIVTLRLSYRKPSNCIMVMSIDTVRRFNWEGSLHYHCHVVIKTLICSACVSAWVSRKRLTKSYLLTDLLITRTYYSFTYTHSHFLHTRTCTHTHTHKHAHAQTLLCTSYICQSTPPPTHFVLLRQPLSTPYSLRTYETTPYHPPPPLTSYSLLMLVSVQLSLDTPMRRYSDRRSNRFQPCCRSGMSGEM